ncbi:MAG TPA: hypothetical protein VEN28_16540 [Burkholderiaceae bacterium]|nr:hypothetical protein [Burkholderiaceae bacterium]
MVTAKKRTRPPLRRPPPRQAPPAIDLRPAFAALKALLVKHARHLVVVHDAPDEYYLNTRKPGPDGKPMFFGAVELKRGHVVYQLMPLRVDAALSELISPALRKHLQGKHSFTLTEPDPLMLEELDRLNRAGMASFERKGLA